MEWEPVRGARRRLQENSVTSNHAPYHEWMLNVLSRSFAGNELDTFAGGHLP